MKRFTILFIAAVCAMMFISSAYADDKVAISGEFRVRAWDITSQGYTKDRDSSYFDQRLRIGTKINVADDVNIQLRADYGEGTWGNDYNTITDGSRTAAARPRKAASNTLDIDRGFVEIKKEMWGLRAGQQYLGLGINQVLDANATGFKFDLNFSPVVTTLMYVKLDENGSLTDDNDVTANSEDEDLYALNVAYTCDMFKGNVFVAGIKDDTNMDNSPIMAGIQGSGKLGIVDLTSELAIASGDTDNGATDYIGTQFFLGGYVDVAQGVNVGAELLYAKGTTEDNEEQFSYFSKWGDSFHPMDMNTPFAGEFSGVCFVDIFDPFEAIQDSSGVQAITLQAKYSPMDILSLGAKVAYLKPDEDIISNTNIDADASATSFNAWATYTITTNTQLWLTYLYTNIDVADNYDSTIEAQKVLVSQLSIKF